jgi:hypothetical protein
MRAEAKDSLAIADRMQAAHRRKSKALKEFARSAAAAAARAA